MKIETRIKKIMREVEYEWSDDVEKKLQNKFEKWRNSYRNEIGRSKTVSVPVRIADDFWRDMFTDVVQSVHSRVEKELNKLGDALHAEGEQ